MTRLARMVNHCFAISSVGGGVVLRRLTSWAPGGCSWIFRCMSASPFSDGSITTKPNVAHSVAEKT